MQRESMEFDVLIIGAGPAGLATAIRLKQLASELNVCILEKAADVGAHLLSGAVIETKALDELMPDWQDKGAPLKTKVTKDEFLFLTKTNAFKLPTPKQMHNTNNYIVSLSNLGRWLGEQAEALGVEIYAGFPGAALIVEDNIVKGVQTGDMGVSKSGEPGPQYQPGMNLMARYTVLAEGARGSLTKECQHLFDLNKNAEPQTYGIGVKELWEVDNDLHETGKVIHSIGWPLDNKTYGGSFIYHREDNKLALGFVVGLDYQNPYLSPYEELQRFKTHPAIKPYFENGKRIAYGARALNEGGYQSIGQCAFPGGVIIGCAAGFLNVPKIKGTHTAMKSGMLAAESIAKALSTDAAQTTLSDYDESLRASWIFDELKAARNIRPAFKHGLYAGLVYAALDTYVFRGKAPWTFKHHHDHSQTQEASWCQPIDYPKPDGVLTFDKLTSLSFSNVYHEEEQPVHLKLKDETVAVATNYTKFAGLEARYCPAGVYEYVTDEGKTKLQINAQNCIHCKTCDIKDPTQNINWTTPEGGGGPNYPDM